MAKKLFQLALESSDLEGAVAPESTEPALDESQLEENVEETTQAQAEVEAGSDEIDEAIEEVDQLQEQIEANDQKLENPDEVVTTVDVEVSEESLKRACYKLGIPMKAKLSFATESVVDDIKSNPRKYLAVSNEGLKDTLDRIKKAIIAMIDKVVGSIQTIITRIQLKFGNYEKRLDNGLEKLKNLNKIDFNDPGNIVDLLSNGAELRYAAINSDVYLDGITNFKKDLDAVIKIQKQLATQKVKKDVEIPEGDELKKIEEFAAQVNSIKVDVVKFGFIRPDYKVGDWSVKGDVYSIYGTKGLTEVYNVVELEPNTDTFNSKTITVDSTKLINNIISKAGIVKKAIKDAKNNFKDIIKMQTAFKADINSLNDVNEGMVKYCKKCCVNFANFKIKQYVAEIAAYVQLVELVAKNTDVKTEEKAK